MKTIIRSVVLLAVAGVLALVGPAAVANASPGASHPGKHVTQQDKDFLRAAHQSNLAEIADGNLALQKSSNPSVRALGAMWIADHTRLDADLAKVAATLGVALPAKPNAEQRALARKLQELSGAEFDKAWIKGETTGHRKAKANGQRELKKGSNELAIAVAQTSAPIIEHHLQELLDLQ